MKDFEFYSYTFYAQPTNNVVADLLGYFKSNWGPFEEMIYFI